MNLVVDCQYFPVVDYVYDLSNASNVEIEQYDRFRKMSFRNKCVIAGGNGKIQLSVPLAGGRDQRALMKDVRVSISEDWQARHWKTLQSCYNRSPFFDLYAASLEPLYRAPFTWLVDWNQACLDWICDKLSIEATRRLTSSYIERYDEKSVIDHRDRYLPAAMKSIRPAPARYPQVFEERWGFIPHLSILDRLFCAGPRL